MSAKNTITPEDIEYAAQRLRQSSSFARGEAHRTCCPGEETTDDHDEQFQPSDPPKSKLDPVAAMHRFNNPPKR
ncbi:hypothetical protein [Afipia clevelandensis]|uniref:Uncharacterized protein n=1 Tax=Afipia clevelandensis ATCC 49720 TaxID=883079 RepID=K8P6X4_9BRAD|nr:hypothetical protein [Afipia clevelandensis]EKS35390.1 hypothetical protein HMPREF9696_02662 [Afipia clevelandensis ATCC 49720]